MNTLKGHIGIVHTVEFSRDGKRIASGGSDNTSRIWDATTASQHIERLMGMIRLVFTAIRGTELYNFADPTLTRRMNAEGIALAEGGFVPPPVPIDVLFVQRKLAGVFLIAANLQAKLPLEQIIRARLF